jgi:hypothetical protein
VLVCKFVVSTVERLLRSNEVYIFSSKKLSFRSKPGKNISSDHNKSLRMIKTDGTKITLLINCYERRKENYHTNWPRNDFYVQK